jgi:2'-hydroxyisoflavone reductase
LRYVPAVRILFLGGTSFVGRHAVDAAIARGHDVTLFNRGQTNPELFGDADKRTGDRETGDYASLAGGEWDAVVDVNGYIPRHVEQSMAAVGDVGRYLFISTGSVYDPAGMADESEDAPRFAPERDTEEITNESYGPLKVACEDDVLARYGDAATIVRPGIVAGPHDPSDRFTWWVRRLARGGDVVAPNRSDQPVQVIDGRDLGAFVIGLLEDDTSGVFNAVGPADAITLEDMCLGCVTAAGSAANVHPIDLDFLHEHEVPWFQLLLPADGSYDGLFRRSHARGRAAGLTHRPLVETAADTLAWDRERGEPEMPGTITPEQEATVLAAWQTRQAEGSDS